jgi:hypothetical protein
LQAAEIVIFNFPHLFRFLLILADLGKFFSHRFSHNFNGIQCVLALKIKHF